MTDVIEAAVIGGGVVGLATARALAAEGRDVVVLERHTRIGSETSSRNSEVIHAGLYYPTDSLKAKLCVTGKHSLYAYLRDRNIGHRKIGKLIVAVDRVQQSKLEDIAAQAERNGVRDLRHVDGRATGSLEPNLRAAAGLWSPSTGIVDAHALMLSLQADLEAAGGAVALRSAVVGGQESSRGLALTVDSGGSISQLRAEIVVNCAGLYAETVARSLPPCADVTIPRTRFARGNYFLFAGRSPFRHLIYPLPVAGGLGIHATLDLAGALRFGPDVEWLQEPDYSLDAARAASFYSAIREYWPDLPDGSLTPGYCGIRPKLAGPDEPAADFMIERASYAGDSRVVHLFGIESPGLTSALAIAAYVCELAR